MTEEKKKMTAFAVAETVLILLLYAFSTGAGYQPFWGFGAMSWMPVTVLSFLIVFCLPLPYDSLAAAASNREGIPGKLAYLVLLARIAALRTAFFAFFLAMAMVMIFFLPLVAGVILVMVVGIAVRDRLTGNRREDSMPVFGLILLITLACVFALGLLAPVKVAAIALFFLRGMPAGGPLESAAVGKDWFPFETAIGIAGIVGVTAWLMYDAFWRLRQARQVENLATSKVRALAMGLVEVAGIVHPVAAQQEGPAIEISRPFFEYLQPTQHIELFRLDDGTGSVLVDARECRVRAGWLAEIYSIFGIREIVLTKRIDHNLFSDSEQRTLHYGDRIYLIGSAERDPNAATNAVGPDSLIIRPSTTPTWGATFIQTLFSMKTPPMGKDIHNVFFLTDSGEIEARKHILRGFRSVLLFALFWLTVSIGLIWSATLPERAAPRPDSWRAAYWRGPEPDPNPMVRDYTRNTRLFRFERYIKTLGPKSYDQIPALIEAVGYKDYRFHSPATSALLRMLPEAKEQVLGALPAMIGHLDPCTWNAESLQTMIIAVGGFGPDAAPAVPKLIEALQCTKTGTYVVTAEIIRMQAARALGRIGPAARSSVPALQEALNDVAPYVRSEAGQALRLIGEPVVQEERSVQENR